MVEIAQIRGDIDHNEFSPAPYDGRGPAVMLSHIPDGGPTGGEMRSAGWLDDDSGNS